MPNVGLPEIIIVLVIALVIFGPKRLPELGRSLGSGMRGFKDSVSGKGDDDQHEQLEADSQPEDAKREPAREPARDASA